MSAFNGTFHLTLLDVVELPVTSDVFDINVTAPTDCVGTTEFSEQGKVGLGCNKTQEVVIGNVPCPHESVLERDGNVDNEHLPLNGGNDVGSETSLTHSTVNGDDSTAEGDGLPNSLLNGVMPFLPCCRVDFAVVDNMWERLIGCPTPTTSLG
ncbi:hypothetical protein TNCT_256151 [Trichonephila clavata]|uniref:Uncharacterized protein n=1 Tax=Trichonephila clavata TaxID=2740835 RepID=A0A8X6G516_TRICU|nr:hypothetical protein TNCT_256151 [Trichonephila clavata]